MSNPPRPAPDAGSVAATRLMLAMLDDDHAAADRVLAEADSVSLLKGLLAWALAFGDRAARGDKNELRRVLREQQRQGRGTAGSAS